MRSFRGPASRSIVRVAAQWLVVTMLLDACAPAVLERGERAAEPAAPVQAFEVTGRLSARHGSDAVAANFRWRHAGENDQLELVSPFGQTIAQLSGDSAQARLQSADGRVATASDWTTLTEQGLGWPLPVQGLAFWIQGAARPGTAFSVETGDDGRTSVLRQDGWTIVYPSYAQTRAGAWRPSRVNLSYPEVELRLAIDAWE